MRSKVKINLLFLTPFPSKKENNPQNKKTHTTLRVDWLIYTHSDSDMSRLVATDARKAKLNAVDDAVVIDKCFHSLYIDNR